MSIAALPRKINTADYDGRFKDAAALNRRLRLLWIGIGVDDFLYEGVRVSRGNLEKAGVVRRAAQAARCVRSAGLVSPATTDPACAAAAGA